ncbi:putative HAF family extracellular repeat protein [Afipia massiliensis]|uniref:Putative HAF family extracellular repeat protein n=1 Tax=Afipia massiliensis TaxID=211460 RepID=A0A840N528_9BRAD|nr:autotransporter domain-containing protein [Afipia massiliensis]MBB5054270.1 putative HAF family extracellular repeat protein [Afipia massiliensis]
MAALALPSVASARDGIEVLTGTGLGSFFELWGMSRNGRFLFGVTDGGAGNYRSWIYSNGTYSLVPAFADPTLQTSISAINDTGTVWVGYGQFQGPNNVTGHAIRYADGVFTDLHTGTAFGPGGSLQNYNESFATAMSADTNVVAGFAVSDLGIRQAFRWTQVTGTTGLGFLSGYRSSNASAISADGTTIVGYVGDPPSGGFSYQAMYWTAATGMVGLGSLPTAPGQNSFANAASANGSVIVGNAVADSAGNYHAFRWTQATGMQDLGTLPGGVWSSASAVSADGAIVAGISNDAPLNTGPMFAFRWTQATGMQKLSDLLAARGISPGPGMVLGAAKAMSADGKITIGDLTDQNRVLQGYYIARCQSVICQGLTTYDQMASSYAGQSAVGQTANAAIGGTLGTMQEYATQAYQTQGSRSTPYSVFGYGAYDSDPIASGTLGLTADLPFGLVAGFSASANYVKTDMVNNGNAKMFGGAVGAFIARTPNTGLQWLLGGSLIALTGDITRGYLNGVTPTSSTGSASGNGYGATARIGWGFAVLPQVTVTPFASYTFAETRFGGYGETNGVFASNFDDFISTSQVSRVGGDVRYTFAPNSWVWGTAAWGHRLDSGKGANITGTLVDAQFAFTSPGLSSARDWAEVGGGVRLPAWTNGAVTASVTASLTPGQVVTYVSRLGISQTF